MSSPRHATTEPERITRVGVVGAGQMGAGIAEVCARAHVDVLVWESTRELTTAGRDRILDSLDRGVSSGKITGRERDQAALRLRFTTDLTDFADRQLVIEAIVEDEAAKTAVFRQLDEVVTDARTFTDEVAERMTAVGVMPDGRADTVAADSALADISKEFTSDEDVVDITAAALAATIKRLRKNIEKVGEADPVSEDLLIGITARLEQLHWMWQAQTA